MLPGILLILLSVIISSLSQLLLKVSAQKDYVVWWREYINLFVISAYALFFFTTLLNIFALHYIPLTLSAVLGTSGQIVVPVLSYLFLHEKIDKRKCVGMIILALGILVFVF